MQSDLKNQNQDHLDYLTKLKSLESELKTKKEEKDKIDTISANSFLIKTRNILRDIETIFLDTKKRNLMNLLRSFKTNQTTFSRR